MWSQGEAKTLNHNPWGVRSPFKSRLPGIILQSDSRSVTLSEELVWKLSTADLSIHCTSRLKTVLQPIREGRRVRVETRLEER